MTILTEDEVQEGLAELEKMVDVTTLSEDDIQYFRDKLIRGLQRKASAKALERTFKQLALMEDALVIYKAVRLSDNG